MLSREILHYMPLQQESSPLLPYNSYKSVSRFNMVLDSSLGGDYSKCLTIPDLETIAEGRVREKRGTVAEKRRSLHR